MKISVIIPCFNEAANLVELSQKVLRELNKYGSELIFIDDGSNDNTLEVLKSLSQSNPKINYLSFSRNFGHQSAIKAGIDYAKGDCIISMDADLQHPPEILALLIEKWLDGYKIVYTQREDNLRLPFFKRKASKLFYKFMQILSDIDLEEGCADFRLIDKSVADILREFKENNLFIRGLIPWIGFKKFKVIYKANDRFSGSTKYSIRKMVSFAMNGITSFSIKPLRISAFLGVIVSSLAFFYSLYAIYIYFFTDRVITGWASVLISVLFMGGIQLIMLGIIGEYLGKAFIQTKGRPNYIVAEISKGLTTKT